MKKNNTSSHEKKWLIIVNPNAGRRKIEKDWDEIAELLYNAGFDYERIFTKRKYHAIELTQKYIEKGYKNIIAVGGDGTMNEVVNGIFLQKKYPTTEITLGMISVGTGNDWARTYKISSEYKKAIEIIKKRKTFVQDAGLVTYDENGNSKKRYFVNIAGMGYDALVAIKTNAMKEKKKGGPFAYLFNLVTGLFQYKNLHLEITIDDKIIFNGVVFSLSIGICKYNGGGIMQLPNAIPDDGIYDITLIKKITKFRVIKSLSNMYDGSFIKLPEIETFTGKEIIVTSQPKHLSLLETDGESLGHSPLHFEVVPKSVKLIVNKVPG